jgi:hypothetical protein
MDLSVVHLHDVVHDRQTQAQPAVGACDRALGLHKAIEHVRNVLGAQAEAGVGHRNLRGAAEGLETHHDPAASRCELDGVIQQVGDDLLQARRVPVHRTGRVAHQEVEPHALRLGRDLRHVDCTLHHAREVDGLKVEQQLAGHDARDVEQVVD